MFRSLIRSVRVVTASVFLLAAAQLAWLELKSAHASILYQAGFEDDAQRIRGWLEDDERVMQAKYGVTPSRYRMSIYLHPAPTANADVNKALNRCCQQTADGLMTGTIDMLAPSAPAMRSATAISSLGLSKRSDDYHAKILMSEYIPIAHYEAQNSRLSGGWKYYSAPNWVVQGLQEYDAIFHTTAGNRDVTAKRLSAWATTHRTVFSCCSPDVAITDDRNGGAAFMDFLAVQFGEGVHARLLRSSEPTFEAALTEVTAPYTRSQLFARFQEWLERGAPSR